MKINEILVESVQLDEGPFGSMAKAAGAGIGKAVKGVAKGVGKGIGGVAKAAGAVAGAAQGAKQAYAQGKQAGVDVVAGTGQGADAAPEDEEPAAQTVAPTAQQINQQGPKGSAPAKTIGGVAKQALQKTAQAIGGSSNADQAGQTLYAQVKSQVNQLDKKGKQRILQLLQKSLAQPAPTENPVTSAVKKVGNTVKKAISTKPNQTQKNLAKTGNPVGATTQTAGLENNNDVIAESFSIYRKK
jgi:hypothetical protein